MIVVFVTNVTCCLCDRCHNGTKFVWK